MAKQKFVVWEVYTVDAESAEEAEEKAKEASKNTKAVIKAAPSLRELPHPVHLQETNDAFGSIGAGGKADR